MMSSQIPKINLIPDEKVRQRQQAQWISRWMVVVIATTIIIGIPGLYIGGNAALTTSGMTEQIMIANVEYARHQQAIPILKEKLRLLNVEQEVFELVENRIEWRDVFTVLVNVGDNDVRFRSVSASGGGIEGDTPIQIRVDGLASSQTIARAYVVDLEKTNIFDLVELVETTREKINELDLIRFQINITVHGDTVNAAEGSDAE